MFGNLDEILARGKWSDNSSDAATASFGAVLGGWVRTRTFSLKAPLIRRDILIPRYYNPVTAEALDALKPTCDLVSIGEFADPGIIDLEWVVVVAGALHDAGVAAPRG